MGDGEVNRFVILTRGDRPEGRGQLLATGSVAAAQTPASDAGVRARRRAAQTTVPTAVPTARSIFQFTPPSLVSPAARGTRWSGDERLRSATRRLLQQVVPLLPVRLGACRGRQQRRDRSAVDLAEGTFKTLIGRLLAELSIRDRVGLALFAYETGVVGR